MDTNKEEGSGTSGTGLLFCEEGTSVHASVSDQKDEWSVDHFDKSVDGHPGCCCRYVFILNSALARILISESALCSEST